MYKIKHHVGGVVLNMSKIMDQVGGGNIEYVQYWGPGIGEGSIEYVQY